MADAIANFSTENGLKWLDNRTPISGWPFNVYHIGVWDEEYMLGLLKHELRRRGKPIPDDLQDDKYSL
jgi:hypothetical protein